MTADYRNPELSPERRTSDLLGRMTLEEKLGQLNQVFSQPENDAEIRQLIQAGQVGSRILATSWHAGSDAQESIARAALRESQRVAVEESRLGVPLLFGRDVIHGHRTVFPIPLGQAAAWDPDLVEKAAAVAAREASAEGVHWTFSPMLDIARDPRWGRIIEGFGEDPYLCSVLATAMVKGYQGEDPSQPGRILACAKHFVGYGAAEGGRDYTTTEISENTLRNVYLPPFQAAVRAGVATVMCGFHDLNGRPMSTSRALLEGILRNEWGFDGFVISDWASIEETIRHGTSADESDAAAQALTAGVDMEMVYNCYAKHLKRLVQSGRVSEALVDRAASRILLAKFRLGLFERPYPPADDAPSVQLAPDHRALARQAAARSLVLLQNEANLLPLSRSSGKVALIGPMADAKRELLGNWTLDGRAHEAPSLQEALSARWPGLLTCPASANSDTMLRAARGADVVIVAVGEDHLRNGENANLAELVLPPGQEELVQAVSALGKRIVLVVCSGRPLVLTRLARWSNAILWAWHPGTEGASAIAETLLGLNNPSGKLPVSFPRATGQVPIYYNHKSSGRPVDDYYGWDSRYQDIPGSPLYPFGFGLSYTRFTYTDFRISESTISREGRLVASALVTNAGQVDGEEVVQCYVRDQVASTTRPVRELKGFQRLLLAPGQSKRATFVLGTDELSFCGEDGRRRLEPGVFNVWIGGDSHARLGGEFAVAD